jgi:hypothetical protein
MEDSITSKSDKGEESPIKINTLREVKLQSLSCIICVVFCRSLFVLFNFFFVFVFSLDLWLLTHLESSNILDPILRTISCFAEMQCVWV